MKRLFSYALCLSAALLLSVADAPAAVLQQHQHPQQPADKAKPQSDMAARCQAMMAQHEKMMTEMKAADQRLSDLVAKMNSASSQAKVDATAAVVNELVSQRKAMHEHMMAMQHGVASHMMEHMQAGADSMAACPMMKGMGGMMKK